MTLKEQINADFLAAYKAKEMTKKNFLGTLKSQIQNNETKELKVESTDENVLKVIKSFEKGLNETIEAKKKLNQATTDEELELSFLQPYLPKLMSEDEVRVIVTEILARPNINKNAGFLMGTFNKENNGKAFDNKIVQKLFNEQLAK